MRKNYDDFSKKCNPDFPFHKYQQVFYLNWENKLCKGIISSIRHSLVELDECFIFDSNSKEGHVVKKDKIFPACDTDFDSEKNLENRCIIKLIKKVKDCPYCGNMPMIVPNSFDVHSMNMIQIKCIKCGVTGPRVEMSYGFCETIKNYQELAKLAVEEWNKIC